MARTRKSAATFSVGSLHQIDPNLIDEDPNQPRQEFDQKELDQLVQSVGIHGVVQPLEVIPLGDGRYRLVAGARRRRAALLAGLKPVPCLISEAHGSLVIRQRQLLENMQRADLTPLEQAQSLYTIWLHEQIRAMEAEQGQDGSVTEQLLADSPTPTGQITTLESRVCELAGCESMAIYSGAGSVRVPWQRVLEGAGLGSMSEAARKKLLAVLKLPAAVQDALAGRDVSARTLRDLAKHGEAEALELIDKADQQAEGDIGNVLRDVLDAPLAEPVQQAEPHIKGQDSDFSLDALTGDLGSEKERDEDYEPLLTSSGGTAARLVTDQVAPSRGTPPPASAAIWPEDDALVLREGLEACLSSVIGLSDRRFSGPQARALGVLWRELEERMQAAGIDDDGETR
jgi:hypothetical protein